MEEDFFFFSFLFFSFLFFSFLFLLSFLSCRVSPVRDPLNSTRLHCIHPSIKTIVKKKQIAAEMHQKWNKVLHYMVAPRGIGGSSSPSKKQKAGGLQGGGGAAAPTCS